MSAKGYRERIKVGLAERAYDIVIANGLREEAPDDIARLKLAKRYALIADRRVAELYGEGFTRKLNACGLKTDLLSFPPGEASKNLQTLSELAGALARAGLDRSCGLIALGGGVSGDICGFLASIYMRGIPFIQIPTSLLAQVDSSVGGKTGVDIAEGKNLLGTFYQPRAVYIDPQMLNTLPQTELLNGLAEVIKYGVIYDSSLFEQLALERERILAADSSLIGEIIARCCRIKAEIVGEDEQEKGLRRILNFGHTIGHAIEAASDFQLAHGMAVSIGMALVAKISVAKGLWNEPEAASLCRLLDDYGLPTRQPVSLDLALIKSYLKTDKKSVGGRPVFVLPVAIGKVVIDDDVDERLIDLALSDRL